MPHLKCEPCGSRMYKVGADDQVDDVCPDCGSVLEPVGELAELVGLKLTRPANASDAGEPAWQQRIADQLADIIVRRQAVYADRHRD